METFPNEGKISTITLSEQQIKHLEEYLIKEKGITDSKMSKIGSNGIGWNEKSYWYIKDFNKSGKNDYLYYQISKFIEPNEFKKGDYVVVTKEARGYYGTLNYCYEIIRVDNQNKFLYFELTKSIGLITTEVRYATQQEIAEYNRIGKPYDVTTLKSELTHENLQNDIVYYVTYGDCAYLIKKDSPNYVILHRKLISISFYHGSDYKYQLATPEQIQHYNNCIKAGKYVEPNVKSIEPWSVGTYVVIVEKQSGVILPKGTVREILKFNNRAVEINGDLLSITREQEGAIKWFATKNEAEEFAKTLVEPKLTWDKLVPGKVYYSECVVDSKSYIWKYKANTNNSKSYIWVSNIIKIKDNIYTSDSGINDKHWDNLREATSNEIQWLEKCIKYKKYVSEDYEEPKSEWNIGDAFQVTCDYPQGSELVKNTTYYVKEVYSYYVNASRVKTLDDKVFPNSVAFEDMKKVEVKPEPHKFEVGKWYKFYWTWNNEHYYGKFDRTSENENAAVWHSSIRLSNKIMYNDFHILYSELSNPVLLEDLTEIQQYLPEGHVDKIKSEYIPQVGDWVVVLEGTSGDSRTFNNQCKKVTEVHGWYIEIEGGKTGLNISSDRYSPEFRKAQPYEIPNVKQELEKGKYYQITYSDYPDQLYVVLGNDEMHTLNYLSAHTSSYGTSNTFSKICIQIQPASEEQIAWLDRCISANKFVPKELSKDELLEIAKQKYPVGTIVNSLVDGYKKLIIHKDAGYYWSNAASGIWAKCEEKNVLLYRDGKWAEIVDKPGTISSADFMTFDQCLDVKTIYTEVLTTTECIEKYSHTVTELADGKKLYRPNWVYGSNICNEIELPTWENACVNRIPKCEIELQLKGKVQLDTRVNHIQSTTTNLYKKSKSIIFNNN